MTTDDIIRKALDDGDILVDAKRGRNFIGCELNPEYHAMATKRIQEAWEASPSLF